MITLNPLLVCARCGYSDIRALQIDHIHGGGTKENKLGYYKMLMRIIRYPEWAREHYQVLCSNCNSIKRVEQQEENKRKAHLALCAKFNLKVNKI